MDETNEEMFSSTSEQFNNPSAIDIRLNASKEILYELERNLRGADLVYRTDENGNTTQVVNQFGKPIANNEGIQKIMSILRAIINPGTVQGNFKEDYFQSHIAFLERDLCDTLLINQYVWEMEIKDIHSFHFTAINLIIPFFSRLINNEERKSMSITTHTQESNTVQNGSQGFNIFGRGK